ncbi:MAG TPA: DUF3467 domain-containing protein [Pyrinomonadaceae bacterium]|jgi:hypothetical protein|nr:DUF3467 domain-containing protein [Pyrinomonadaceae bacterium]
MADENKDAENAAEEIKALTYDLPVKHYIPDDVNLTYCDNFIIQHTANEFTLIFSQVQQPIVQNDDEYGRLESVRAKVMARIVFTPRHMSAVINALIQNWNLHQEIRKKELEARKNVSTTAPAAESPAAGDDAG